MSQDIFAEYGPVDPMIAPAQPGDPLAAEYGPPLHAHIPTPPASVYLHHHPDGEIACVEFTNTPRPPKGTTTLHLGQDNTLLGRGALLGHRVVDGKIVRKSDAEIAAVRALHPRITL